MNLIDSAPPLHAECYWITAQSMDEAYAIFAKRWPAYAPLCPTCYHKGNTFMFEMNWNREMAVSNPNHNTA